MSEHAVAREAVRDSLRPGEVLHELPLNELYIQYGYIIHSIEDAEGHIGETVYRELPGQDSCVEAVALVGDRELCINAIYGSGWLVVHRADTDRIHAHDLTAEDGERTIRLRKDDEYAYVNTAKSPFIVRDDAPGFIPSDEVPATSPRLLKFLRNFSVKF